MLDYPKVELEPFKKGGKIRKQKQKQKQKQTQRQIVNVNIGNKGTKKSYARRKRSTNANALQPQQPQNMMYYPPPMTTIIQNPNQPQQLPDMITLLNLFRSQGPKAHEQKTINELRLENLEKRNLINTTNEEKKSLKDDDKPYIPPEEKKYLDFIDDDARNANIRNAPISNPLLDNNSLPSVNSGSLSLSSPPPLPPLQEVQLTKTVLSRKLLPELIKIAIDNNLYNFTTEGKQGVSMGGKTIRQMTAKELRRLIYKANLPDSKIYPSN
jgi:hypothetical protein